MEQLGCAPVLHVDEGLGGQRDEGEGVDGANPGARVEVVHVPPSGSPLQGGREEAAPVGVVGVAEDEGLDAGTRDGGGNVLRGGAREIGSGLGQD